MKRNQIIILSLFLIVTGLIYVGLMANKPEAIDEKTKTSKVVYVPIRSVKNEIRTSEITSYGQISPIIEIDIAFEVQGRLQKGSITMKPGIRFSAGQVLYSVDVEETKQTLNARKIQFANLLIGAMPDIELDYPSQTNKWIDFLNQIQTNKSLPELPAINSGKERMFLTSRSILSEYYNIKSLEERYKKYTYTAPWSGTVVEVVSEPGSIINPGVKIARIAKTGDFEVKVPITLSQIEMYKSKGTAIFTNSKGEKVGTGTILRISDVINQSTQSVDVFYSIKPSGNVMIYNGMFLNASISQKVTFESMAIPRMAVKDNKINVLQDGKLISREIEIMNTKPDTVFVTGLKNGESVVLEQIQTIEKDKTYKGINR